MFPFIAGYNLFTLVYNGEFVSKNSIILLPVVDVHKYFQFYAFPDRAHFV